MMMLQSLLTDLLRDTIHHAPAIGFNGAGEPIHGDEVAHPARVARKQRTVIAKSGEVAVSKSQVWLAAPLTVGFGDRIRLPDGTTPPILAFDHLPDETGNLFTKVYL